MKEIKCVQGSPDWWEARKGRVTASEVSRIVQAEEGKVCVPIEAAKGLISGGVWDGVTLTEEQLEELEDDYLKATKSRKFIYFTGVKRSDCNARQSYMSELLAESEAGWMKADFRGSPDIERGLELESEARRWLAMEIGEDVYKCGVFVSDCGRFGASPDGMTSGGCPVELKCPDFHTQIRYLIQGRKLPNDYKQQVHAQLALTGAPYAWFCSYVADSRIPSYVVKVKRSRYTEELDQQVVAFCDWMVEVRGRIFKNVKGKPAR